jgi:hypothetical protein
VGGTNQMAGSVTLRNLGNMGNVYATGVQAAGIFGGNTGSQTTLLIENCFSTGAIEGGNDAGALVGWGGSGGKATINNCWSCSEVTGYSEGKGLYFARVTDGHLSNNYCTSEVEQQVALISYDEIMDGSLCYKLNGDQSTISWTQTIGTDLLPQMGTGSKRVYASGTLRCDGTEIASKPLEYSNTESYPTTPEHKFGNDGICTVCGQADPDAVKQNEDGYYLISTPKQLNWLVQKINGGDTNLKVLLTEDIDLSQSDYPDLMIGTSGAQYRGTFDGQGHTVTYSYEVNENYCGLFRYVDGATIRNLNVKGDATVRTIHFGALVGWASNTVLIENVITDVDITGEHTGVTGDGGMFGRLEGNVTFNNCATLGAMGNPGSSMYCGFVAFAGSGSSTLNNCYTASVLKEGTGTDYCFTFCRGTYTANNCYYVNAIGEAQGIPITEDQLESGELCYKLNGDQSRISWYQDLGRDAMPVPDDSHAKVYGAGETYVNIIDEAGFRSFVSDVISEETERYQEMVVQKSLVEAYLEALEGLSESPDIETFLAAYNDLGGQRQSIENCAKAYSNYIAKVEETKLYLEEHPELSNEKSEALKNYLNEYNEPSEDYPNGSAPVIIEDCELNEEEIIAETALIETRLTEAIAYSPTAGTDITMLFTNTDFSDQFNGWEGKPATSSGSSETSPIRAAECFNNTMDMYQTLSGLQNGIYELQVNGAFRPYPYNDYYNTNYAATLYANGIHNYFQTNIEDMISVDDAIDGENCHLTGSIADFSVPDPDGDIVGYTMQGIIGCCNAFKAGRYPNSVLCNVTDGTLTIGIRQPGTGQQPDWLGFGNIKVIYWGQMDKATESLDRVLASQSARAHTILETYEYSSGLDYATYPNFSQALKDELSQTLKAIAGTTDAAAKYQLVEKFSELFLKIYECKKAYITLMDKAEEVNDLQSAFSDLLSEEDFMQLENLYQMLTNAYMDGTMSAEEALSIDLKSQISFYPDEEDGYFLLRNETDFIVFANMVNGGSTKINAKLLTDVDLSKTAYPDLMIGTETAEYAGIFDGCGHTITYHYENVSEKWRGLFAFVNGATIRNLRVEGSVYVTQIHYGALIGRAYGTVLVENVVTDVDITGAMNQVTGDGGMLGANYANITFNNCATFGTMGYEGSSMYCGFVAWDNGGTTTTLNNCYTACTLTEGTGLDYCYTFCRTNGTVRMNNCYYLNQVGVAQGTKMTEEQFQSGEVCYKLNGDQSDPQWFQTIGEEAYPMPFSGAYVDFADGNYYNAIEKVADEKTSSNDIYDLQGRKLEKISQKGIYIINRKKISVK